mmetsp:Transcript_2671/g.4145  ORF Transcript_2671/g.4145 Transcript_2671/m.4145 type:complete len:158 (+) Transcript_2671:60-533(+)
MADKIESVQTFGRKKTATAVAFVKKGSGLIKVNGSPIALLQPEILRLKTYEPMLLLGQDKFANVDIRVRVKGGGTTSQIYAIRQAVAKGMVAYYQKYVDEASKRERLRKFSPHTIEHCSWRTPVDANPRSSVVLEHVPATRSPTVKRMFTCHSLLTG